MADAVAHADFVGSGWSYPLGVRPDGSIATAGGVEKLEQAMRIVLTTYPGERPMRPEFGSRLRDYVFDGVTGENSGRIAAEVERALRRWEPRVEVDRVDVTPLTDDVSAFHVDVSYVVRGTNEERNLVFPFYTIPDEEG